MEDSGYYSHKSREFKLSSSSQIATGGRRKLFSRSLLNLSYDDFKNSDTYKEFVNGFRDASDFEEFKQDLREFYELQKEVHEDSCSCQKEDPATSLDMLMEFFDSDEHFKEFDDVFDAFKRKRYSNINFDNLLRPKRDSQYRQKRDSHHGDDPGLRDNRDDNDLFSDFFDTDEDFQAFEREFSQFKIGRRRSRGFNDFLRRSACDLFSDLCPGPSPASRPSSMSQDGEFTFDPRSDSRSPSITPTRDLGGQVPITCNKDTFSTVCENEPDATPTTLTSKNFNQTVSGIENADSGRRVAAGSDDGFTTKHTKECLSTPVSNSHDVLQGSRPLIHPQTVVSSRYDRSPLSTKHYRRPLIHSQSDVSTEYDRSPLTQTQSDIPIGSEYNTKSLPYLESDLTTENSKQHSDQSQSNIGPKCDTRPLTHSQCVIDSEYDRKPRYSPSDVSTEYGRRPRTYSQSDVGTERDKSLLAHGYYRRSFFDDDDDEALLCKISRRYREKDLPVRQPSRYSSNDRSQGACNYSEFKSPQVYSSDEYSAYRSPRSDVRRDTISADSSDSRQSPLERRSWPDVDDDVFEKPLRIHVSHEKRNYSLPGTGRYSHDKDYSETKVPKSNYKTEPNSNNSIDEDLDNRKYSIRTKDTRVSDDEDEDWEMLSRLSGIDVRQRLPGLKTSGSLVDGLSKRAGVVERDDSPAKDCNYTCHHRCRPAVTLDCTKVLLGNGDFSNGPVNDDAPSTEESTRTEESTKTDRTSLLQSSNYALEPPASTVNSHSDETDSGYRSGPLLDEGPLLDDVSETSSTDTTLTEAPCPSPGNTLTHDELTRDSLSRQIEDCNDNCPFASITLSDDDLSFQGFLRVTLNLIRPITMSLGLRPPSIYEILTREHIVEQNTMEVSFYMPRDTVKAIHVTSTTTTKEVIASLLKKFKILDNARKFAMYEQEVRDKKIVKIRRVVDKETPLHLILEWGADHIGTHRLVLQENETGEVEWGAFSLPELNNFLRILDREEDECISQLGYKYKVMKRIIHQRLKELRKERSQQQVAQQQRS